LKFAEWGAEKIDYMDEAVPQGATVPLTRALGAIAVAPFVGSVILTAMFLTLAPALFVYILPFAYGTAALFVLPILVVWPAARRPSYLVAALWGGGAACCARLVLASRGLPVTMSFSALSTLTLFWSLPGGGSGVFYAWLVRLRDD
jgi:hypothetical protein